MSSFSTPRRLLVITYHFPPDGAVGGLRWAGLSKYLARRGWDIHVITAADQKDRPQVPGVTVHHCPRNRTVNDVYKDWVTGRRARMSAATPAAAAAKGASQPVAASGGECAPRNESIRERTRRTLGAAIAFPDYARGWVFRAAALAQSLQTSITFDVVVSSGPPHSAHIAGVLACFGRHSTYVADLRDPWSPTAGAQALNNSRWMGATLAGLERVVFARANRVIVNTPEFAGVLRTTKPALAVSYIPNGIDTDRLPPPAPRFERLTISYLGTLYLGRDLTPVIRAMKAFVARHPETHDAITLRVAGYMDPEHHAKFWSEVGASDLHDAVDVRASVPPVEALNIINRSHLTLVLAQDQPTQIPAKLYECVAMRIPTLVIGESNSAAYREAKRIGALACEADDIDGIRRIIERVWQHPSDANPPAVPIGYDDIAGQMDAVLRRSLAGTNDGALAGVSP